jgi:hypothetical protein
MKNNEKLDNLPPRLYYPLPEAAKKLECTIQDVIHMGATGILQFSIYIAGWLEKENNRFNIFLLSIDDTGELTDNVSNDVLRGAGWSISGIYKEKITSGRGAGNELYFARALNGFFNVSHSNLIELEFDFESSNVKLHSLKVSESGAENDELLIHSFEGVNFPTRYLCVMSKELESIGNKTGTLPQLEQEESTVARKPNSNKQSQMIKALIEVHYGKGSAEKARSLFNTEKSKGEMLQDFQLRGIRPPVTGKILAEWMKDVDVEYVEISNQA